MSICKKIGIFDSGVGGLTVFKEIVKNSPQADVVYLGDTARLPYGPKSSDTIKRYFEQNVKFLKTQNVDHIIVACNSASTVIDQMKLDLPVDGVITIGAKKAVKQTQNLRIGVIGTAATIKAGAYVKEIKNIKPQIEVFQQACPLLVPLVEENMIIDEVTTIMLKRYLEPLIRSNIDTLILGCTHYPIIKKSIQQIVGDKIHLIDSAEAMGIYLKELGIEGNGEHQIFLTDISDHFTSISKNILDLSVDSIELIDIS